jgi:hypothetical protein
VLASAPRKESFRVVMEFLECLHLRELAIGKMVHGLRTKKFTAALAVAAMLALVIISAVPPGSTWPSVV